LERSSNCKGQITIQGRQFFFKVGRGRGSKGNMLNITGGSSSSLFASCSSLSAKKVGGANAHPPSKELTPLQ